MTKESILLHNGSCVIPFELNTDSWELSCSTEIEKLFEHEVKLERTVEHMILYKPFIL